MLVRRRRRYLPVLGGGWSEVDNKKAVGEPAVPQSVWSQHWGQVWSHHNNNNNNKNTNNHPHNISVIASPGQQGQPQSLTEDLVIGHSSTSARIIQQDQLYTASLVTAWSGCHHVADCVGQFGPVFGLHLCCQCHSATEQSQSVLTGYFVAKCFPHHKIISSSPTFWSGLRDSTEPTLTTTWPSSPPQMMQWTHFPGLKMRTFYFITWVGIGNSRHTCNSRNSNNWKNIIPIKNTRFSINVILASTFPNLELPPSEGIGMRHLWRSFFRLIIIRHIITIISKTQPLRHDKRKWLFLYFDKILEIRSFFFQVQSTHNEVSYAMQYILYLLCYGPRTLTNIFKRHQMGSLECLTFLYCIVRSFFTVQHCKVLESQVVTRSHRY